MERVERMERHGRLVVTPAVNDCGEPAVSQTWSELQLPMCSASLQETNSTLRRDVTLSRYRPPLIGHTAERSIAFRLSEMGQR